MKIGILTFWWSEDNYGQILQCYALQKYLRDKGHDVFLIRYDPRKDYVSTPLFLKVLKAFNPIKLGNFFWIKTRSLMRSLKLKQEQIKNPRNFKEFINTHIQYSEKIYTSYEQLKTNPPKADAYIVGSDQVWNFNNAPLKKVENLINAYFLNFGDDSTKRISYAASWGQTSISQDFKQYISPLLKKFDYISVREKTGLEICKEMGLEAQWVPDPTMLLDKKIYQSLYKNNSFTRPQKPYLFFYFLGNITEISTENVYYWANKKNLEVIYVTGNSKRDRYMKTYASIEQWLFLLANAEYVITNSYHCAVFSTIFNKKYGVLLLKGSNESMNTRLDSLWEVFEIEKRILTENNFEALEKLYNPIFNSDLVNTLQLFSKHIEE